jgi:hypothetical protein
MGSDAKATVLLSGAVVMIRTYEGDEAGAAREDTIEATSQSGLAPVGRLKAVGLEIAAEPPDQLTGSALFCPHWQLPKTRLWPGARTGVTSMQRSESISMRF